MSDNPGLFWIGWARPLGNDDFRQLRPRMLCWRAPDLDRNGTPELDEGWYIDAGGLEQAAALGYQITIDGRELPVTNGSGSFPATLASHLETPGAPVGIFQTNITPSVPALAPPITATKPVDDTPPELAPILIRFSRREGPVMAADLREYGPFEAGEVAPVPYAHAMVFVANGAAQILE